MLISRVHVIMCVKLMCIAPLLVCVCVFQAGKLRKHHVCEEGLGSNIRSLVMVLLLLLLLMFTVHCTWVTSNAYSSPSVVLASHNHDGYDTHTHVCFCEKWGHPIGVMVFILYKLYVLLPYTRDLQPCSWRATVLQISVPTLLQHTCLKLTSSLEDLGSGVLDWGWSWNL